MTEPVSLPTKRTSPFDPPPELAALRAEQPVSRLTLPDGSAGWLVTSHAAVRDALADPRFSARQGEPAPGFFVRMDPPEHTRYRKLLTGQFTQRRMQALTGRIQEITDDHLDALEKQGPPADLIPSFALPIPSLVICELLGVPYQDRAQFQENTAVALDLRAGQERVGQAMQAINRFLGELVARKREEPGDDLISGLIESGDLTDEELTAMSFLLLVAGHETTANMLGLGVYTLLCHPEQLARLRADPSLVDTAVEELLRYLTIMQFGAMRLALADCQFWGQDIKAGDVLILSLPAANRDPGQFSEPDTLDVGRKESGQVAFGHGPHHCLGAQLARQELRLAYLGLLNRFPGLTLAVPADQVPLRLSMSIYGVHQLPVRW